MRINWGLGIAMVMIGFVSFMGFLTFKCFQTPSFLVREDYYEASVNTDASIAAHNRGAALSLLQAFFTSDDSLLVRLPPEYDVNTAVEITAYFASNPSLDWQWTGVPAVGKDGKFSIKAPKRYVTTPSGLHHIKWKFEGQIHIQTLKIATDLDSATE
jgi:hypothetical protein